MIVATLPLEVDQEGGVPLVSDFVLPSDSCAIAVYCAVCPTVTEVGPLMDNPVSVTGGGADAVDPTVKFTVTTWLWPPLAFTTNDA